MADEKRGLAVARRYYQNIVRPLLESYRPGIAHAAARLGTGSDVLGLDDKTSQDHDWGLRLTLLVDADDVADVDHYLERMLPDSFDGLPTRFPLTWDSSTRHRVQVDTLKGFTTSRLGIDASRELQFIDWLCVTGQSVLEVTAGEVFVDTTGSLIQIRDRLAWYPDSVWKYVLAADWAQVSEHLHLMGRTGQRGDELGGQLLATNIVQTAVHLAFLLARRWAPYPKWTGTLFRQIPFADNLAPFLDAALAASDSASREYALCRALDVLLEQQRLAGLPTPEDGATEPFYNRPYRGLRDAVVHKLLLSITDPQVPALPKPRGSIEQWADNVYILEDPLCRIKLVHAMFGHT